MKEGYWSKKVDVQRAKVQSSELSINLISQDYGMNLNYLGCFPLFQSFRKFRSESKWKGPFRFLPTGIFGITSGGGPLISVGIFRSKFAVPFLTNRFFPLIREFGNDIKWQELFLLVGAV